MNNKHKSKETSHFRWVENFKVFQGNSYQKKKKKTSTVSDVKSI